MIKKVSFFENLTEPAGLVVTLNQLKAHLKITGNDEDAELTLFLNAAHDKIACFLNTSLLPFSVRGHYAGFEISQFEKYQFISFKKFPLTTITKVAFWDGTAFVEFTINTDWVLEERNAGFPRILFKDPTAMTTLSVDDDIAYPIIIEANVGYPTADDVPDLIKDAILMYASSLYDIRGDCSGDDTPFLKAIRVAISKYKIRETFG